MTSSSAVHKLTLWQRLAVHVGLILFRLLGLTLRIRATDRAKAEIKKNPRSAAILLWHNRLALALFVFKRLAPKIPLTGLVSASKDGAFLSEIMHAYGIQTARGSSSRRAISATMELISALQAGCNAVITPDGPRGPIYVLKDGTADLAANHAQATYVLGLTASRYWSINSWDRFMIPKPFSTLTLDAVKQEAPQTTETLQQSLMRLNP